MLVTRRNIPVDDAARAEFVASYTVDPVAVAEALIDRVNVLANERARFRRSLMYSVEMIEAPGFDVTAARVC